MKIRPFAALALAALASAPMFSSTAQAIALGNIASQSFLGQPLRIVIPVALVGGETLNAACVRLVGDGKQDDMPPILAARINVERSANNPRLVVTAPHPISEPAMKLSVQAGCDGTVRRDYALLFDPPELAKPAAVALAGADEFAQYARRYRAPPTPASTAAQRTRAVALASTAPAPERIAAAADRRREPLERRVEPSPVRAPVGRPSAPVSTLAAAEPVAPRELVTLVSDNGGGTAMAQTQPQSLPRITLPPTRPSAPPANRSWDGSWPYTAGGFGVLILGLTAFSLRRRMLQHPSWTSSANSADAMTLHTHMSSSPLTFAHFPAMTETAPTVPHTTHDLPQRVDDAPAEDGGLDTLLGDIAAEVIDERAVRDAWQKAAAETAVDPGTDSILNAIAAAERDLQIGTPESTQSSMDLVLDNDLFRDIPRRAKAR